MYSNQHNPKCCCMITVDLRIKIKFQNSATSYTTHNSMYNNGIPPKVFHQSGVINPFLSN